MEDHACRPLLLGNVDNKVQSYLKKMRESGGDIKQQDCDVSCSELLLHFNPAVLKENGGVVELRRNWALLLLEGMKFVKRKATTTSKGSVASFLNETKSSVGKWLRLWRW